MSTARWKPQLVDVLFAIAGLWTILSDLPKWVIVVYWTIAMAVMISEDYVAFLRKRIIEELERGNQ